LNRQKARYLRAPAQVIVTASIFAREGPSSPLASARNTRVYCVIGLEHHNMPREVDRERSSAKLAAHKTGVVPPPPEFVARIATSVKPRRPPV
jgi:hypothetical protein